MKQNDTVTPRQMSAAAFVALLSPLIRRFPRALAETAGRGAWLAPILAALPLAAMLGVLRLFYRKQPSGAGFAEILVRVLGKVPGRVLTGLYGLWFTAYAGFLLRSGAERFISTVYPGAGPGLFIASMTLLCLTAALGRFCAVVRAAALFSPLMAALPVLSLLLTAGELEPALLLPVDPAGLPADLLAAGQTANVIAAVGFLAFFSDRLTRPFCRGDRVWLRAAGVLAVLTGMTVSCLGMFGPALTASMTYPFFMLVRDVSVLGALERIEPAVIALWVLSDFVMLSLLLLAAGKTLRFCFGFREDAAPRHCIDLRHGRWLIPVCAVSAAALALLLPGDLAAFRLLSDTVVPLASAGFMLALPLPVLILGLLRRRI